MCVFCFNLLLAAAFEGLEELKVSDSTGSKDDEEQCKVSMISSCFSLIHLSLKLFLCLVTAAKRLSMLEEIEREFEGSWYIQVLCFTKKVLCLLKQYVSVFCFSLAATKGLEQLKVNDLAGDKVDEEQGITTFVLSSCSVSFSCI